MRSDLLHRIRWANVARAAVLVAGLGLLAAWPSLARPAPDVPLGRAVPVMPAAGEAALAPPQTEPEREPEPPSRPPRATVRESTQVGRSAAVGEPAARAGRTRDVRRPRGGLAAGRASTGSRAQGPRPRSTAAPSPRRPPHADRSGSPHASARPRVVPPAPPRAAAPALPHVAVPAPTSVAAPARPSPGHRPLRAGPQAQARREFAPARAEFGG